VSGEDATIGSEAGSYLRRIHSCITPLEAQGPSRTCNESKEVSGSHLSSTTMTGCCPKSSPRVAVSGEIAIRTEAAAPAVT